jgi:hypothetical protein
MDLMAEFMQTISPIERFVLLARCIDKKTYADIGKCIGSSRKNIPRLIKDILENLSKFFETQKGWPLSADDVEAYLQETDLNL